MQVTTSMGGRLPKQIQRALPLCLAFTLFFLLYSKAGSLTSSIEPATTAANDVLKRLYTYQEPLQLDGEEFPKKIWQIWKIDSLDFEERELTRARTWTTMNPTYRYEALTDGNSLRYVEMHFGPNGLNRPDIVYIYRTLTAKIIQADLLRYLVMYVEGGTYADIDVSAIQPVDNFIPPQFNEKDVDMVISVEIDEPNFFDHKILGPKSESFCQWAFMAKPRAPVIMRLIDHILEWLQDVAQQQSKEIADIELNFDEVLTGTGPSAFTTAVLADMEAQLGHKISWDTFHALAEPVLVGNILVLTVEAFAAGQGHSNSGNHNSPKALVRHHYHASLWPDRHPRYSHPAYGMVEECNWDPECVSKWDSNTENYEWLSDEDKQKLIDEKAAGDAARWDQEQAQKQANEKQEEEDKAAAFAKLCLEAGWTPPPTQEQVGTDGQLVGLRLDIPSQETLSESKPESESSETTAPEAEKEGEGHESESSSEAESETPPAQNKVRRDLEAVEMEGGFAWGAQRRRTIEMPGL